MFHPTPPSKEYCYDFVQPGRGVTVTQLMGYVNISAMVVGYVVFVLALACVIWFGGMWAENLYYKRQRRRKHDREWDNLRSAWLIEQHAAEQADISDRIETAETINPLDRVDTDVLHQTISEIENYQREHHDAS